MLAELTKEQLIGDIPSDLARSAHNGFRWTPTLGCWQAYRNSSTIHTANQEAGQ